MDNPGESRLETFLLDSAERGRRGWRGGGMFLAALLLLNLVLGWYWSREPGMPGLPAVARADGPRAAAPGAATTLALVSVARALLEKPGGYLANDRLPPGGLLDDMPAFEYGALAHVREMTRALRRDFSRSPLHVVEDPDLQRAEPFFNFRHDSWLVPSSESEYLAGVERLESYYLRLTDPRSPGAHFFARADNLSRWLEDVNARLDGHAGRLGRAVATDAELRTPSLEVDDAFHEARGYCWALLVQLRAVQADFTPVLKARGGQEHLAAVIRELEGTQRPVRSPVVLNGSEYGVLANHSLVLAGYVARANAGVLQLRDALGRD